RRSAACRGGSAPTPERTGRSSREAGRYRRRRPSPGPRPSTGGTGAARPGPLEDRVRAGLAASWTCGRRASVARRHALGRPCCRRLPMTCRAVRLALHVVLKRELVLDLVEVG